MNAPRNTPWGIAQGYNRIADGIVAVSTARHGGIWLSPDRMAAFTDHPVGQRFSSPYSEPPWFEEDCDVSAVMLVFPAAFEASAVRAAVNTVLGWGDYQGAVPEWLASDDPKAVALRAVKDAWEAEHADSWETGGMGTVPGGEWSVWLYNVATRERTLVHMSYPTQKTYTTEELDAIRALLPQQETA